MTQVASKPSAPRMTVSVKRLFGRESADYVVMVSMVFFLVIFGLVMVLSSSFVGSALGNDGNFFATFFRQVMWVLLGIPAMLVISRFPARALKKLAPTIFLVALLLQGLVFTPLGITSGGNTNWVNIAGFTGQPSEILKVAMIIWMAAILADRIDQVEDYRTLMRPLGLGVLIALSLVMMGQDLGTMGVMVVIALGIVFLAGARLSHLFTVVAVIAAGVAMLAMLSPSRINRIMTWFSGCTEEDYLGTCWQIVHSTYALGSGGVLGVGLGNSRAKWSWLPHAETDFIFAIVGEELGLIGTSMVIISFVILAVVMARLVRAQPDPFARLVTGGVMVWLIGQALINIAVVLEVLPVLGVPLPFMSVGGSALMASLIGIGVVMSVNRHDAISVTAGKNRRSSSR
ncbi:MAG: putative lipid II flippase FtsW [Pontimonas sp.]|nr:putative lipid II flippase FtsW [Pontimonas sp.]MDP4816191.1 putative lipid II flippase FtsW [Pontimonas sp.]MDP5128226.1 putative lipid II flippase FtsW [Pontimonas sp.]